MASDFTQYRVLTAELNIIEFIEDEMKNALSGLEEEDET